MVDLREYDWMRMSWKWIWYSLAIGMFIILINFVDIILREYVNNSSIINSTTSLILYLTPYMLFISLLIVGLCMLFHGLSLFIALGDKQWQRQRRKRIKEARYE